MRLDHVEKLIAWFGTSDLELLDFKDQTGSLTLRRQDEVPACDRPTSVPPVLAPQLPLATAQSPGLSAIPSPMFGVCYLAPNPDAAPFVTEGTPVTQGTPICVIEAMKVMNTITAPRDGIIRRIVVVDGQDVEDGDCLMEIE